MELKYKKFYIGLSRDGQPFNFVTFRPKKNQLRLELKLPETDDLNAKIESSGVETLEYDKRWGQYRLRLIKNDVKSKAEVIRELITLLMSGARREELVYAPRSAPDARYKITRRLYFYHRLPHDGPLDIKGVHR